MALNNLLSRRQTILLPDGSVNRGGSIDIFEPNTAVRITTYKDSALSEPNTNPVILDAAGKASIWFAVDADMDFRNPSGDIYVSEQSVNPDTLGTGSASGLVPNGSFEIDTDANDEPDGWTRTDETGSTNFLDTSLSTDGLQSMRFESTGSGGGNIVTDDFFTVNDIDDLSVNFDIVSSVANVRNIVRVEWFDVSQVPISNTDVYDNSATNPVVFTSQQTTATPPAGARFAKLRMIGCDPSIATVGSTNYDRVNVFYPLVVSNTFANLLITDAIQVDLADTGNPLNIGDPDPASNPHLALSFNSMQAKGDATSGAGLRLNPFGSAVSINGDVASTEQGLLDIGAATGIDARLRFLENAVVQAQMFHDATASILKVRLNNASDTFRIEEGNGVNIAFESTPDGVQGYFPSTAGTRPNDVQIARLTNGFLVGDLDATIRGLMLTAAGMNTTNEYTPGLLFGSTDAELTTNNPKTLAGIFGRATEAYGADTDGGMALDFFGLSNNPGVTPALERMGTWTPAELRSFGNIVAEATQIDVDNSGASTLAFLLARNSAGGIRIDAIATTGNARIVQTDDAGTLEDIWFQLTRNGGVGIYANNDEMARSVTGGDSFQIRTETSPLTFRKVQQAAGASIRKTGNTNLPDATWTAVSWDIAQWEEPNGWHDGISTELDIIEGVQYVEVSCAMVFEDGGGLGAQRAVRVTLNGTPVTASVVTETRVAGNFNATLSTMVVMPPKVFLVSAGDEVRIEAFQDSGGAQNAQAGSWVTIKAVDHPG